LAVQGLMALHMNCLVHWLLARLRMMMGPMNSRLRFRNHLKLRQLIVVAVVVCTERLGWLVGCSQEWCQQRELIPVKALHTVARVKILAIAMGRRTIAMERHTIAMELRTIAMGHYLRNLLKILRNLLKILRNLLLIHLR
jgi:hypothetical protein